MLEQQPFFSELPLGSSGQSKGDGRQSKARSVCHAENVLAQLDEVLVDLSERMDTLEALFRTLVAQKTVKESYTTQEAAKILEKRPYTVREWCRNRRVNAYKPGCGRGAEEEWRITHDELVRIQNEGLLPPPEHY